MTARTCERVAPDGYTRPGLGAGDGPVYWLEPDAETAQGWLVVKAHHDRQTIMAERCTLRSAVELVDALRGQDR